MTKKAEVVVVAGCSRCGSSLMMQMLDDGGMTTYDGGNRASYEHKDVERATMRGRMGFLKKIPGQAVKILDPQKASVPVIPIAWIWMRRDPVEQAKSQIKFMTTMFPNVRVSTSDNGYQERLTKSLRQDNQYVPIELAKRPKSRVIIVRFEDLIHSPAIVSKKLCDYLGLDLDRRAMRQCVIDREPRCAPDMEIERQRLGTDRVRP